MHSTLTNQQSCIFVILEECQYVEYPVIADVENYTENVRLSVVLTLRIANSNE